MQPHEWFEQWAPPESIWSAWAKPVLFAHLPSEPSPEISTARMSNERIDWAPAPGETAIILELDGDDAVWLGLALAQRGYRPVPLFNTNPGPIAIVPMDLVMSALQAGARVLAQRSLDPNAPPVFLLDSRRTKGVRAAHPGAFDNRWLVFPQDFPSADFLLGHGIREVMIVQDEEGQPLDDLRHILLRWQQRGIRILVKAKPAAAAPVPIEIRPPSAFRSLWQRVTAAMGLRRNSAGGFGSRVPEPSTSGGFA